MGCHGFGLFSLPSHGTCWVFFQKRKYIKKIRECVFCGKKELDYLDKLPYQKKRNSMLHAADELHTTSKCEACTGFN